MNSFPMIERCALCQGKEPRAGVAEPVIKRYRVASDQHAALYRHLRSALAAARDLIRAGHSDVLVRDLLAAPGQLEQWVWEGGTAGGGWREVLKSEAPPEQQAANFSGGKP